MTNKHCNHATIRNQQQTIASYLIIDDDNHNSNFTSSKIMAAAAYFVRWVALDGYNSQKLDSSWIYENSLLLPMLYPYLYGTHWFSSEMPVVLRLCIPNSYAFCQQHTHLHQALPIIHQYNQSIEDTCMTSIQHLTNICHHHHITSQGQFSCCACFIPKHVISIILNSGKCFRAHSHQFY